MKHLLLALLFVLAGAPWHANAQEDDEGTDAQAPTDTGGVQAASGVPFTARLSVESPMPIVYGDDVVISALISAQAGLDISAVRVRPKGVLQALYQDGGVGKSEGGELPTEGIDCPVGGGSLAAGQSILITCRLTGNAAGWKQLFDWNALLDARNAQMEIVIELRDGVDDTSRYYEYISADFVSPKAHVILGGFFGAALWAFFLTLPVAAAPIATAEPMGWRALLKKMSRSLPGLLVSSGSVIGRVLRSALLGGFTALVLIVIAKGTEGLDPPVSVRIQDFWGGMMIGILSTPLAQWLREKYSSA